jgi:hypothetical protein
MPQRETIVKAFAEWTAFSATRSGCPIKSKEDVYPLIRLPDYDRIFVGEQITQDEFNKWHYDNTLRIREEDDRLPIGWATKLINVYLKTRVYLAGEGRQDLIKCIHPPIDNGLWSGIRNEYQNNSVIIEKTHIVSRIKDITTYDIYKKIIEGCRLIAQQRNCYLIEVEELWQGTEI